MVTKAKESLKTQARQVPEEVRMTECDRWDPGTEKGLSRDASEIGIKCGLRKSGESLAH